MGDQMMDKETLGELIQLRARVKELESNYEDAKLLLDKASGEWFQAYRITDEQIDAAVRILVPPNPMPSPVLVDEGIWSALNKLGIFRCEGCGGSGHLPPVITGHFKPLPGSKCPDCAKWGSKGWVIK